MTGGEQDIDLCEKLVDYLNFFEFIASLLTMGQLTFEQVNMAFEYYINLLKKHQWLMKYVSEEGFENLRKLLERSAQ